MSHVSRGLEDCVLSGATADVFARVHNMQKQDSAPFNMQLLKTHR